jgi:hypothetical protein
MGSDGCGKVTVIPVFWGFVLHAKREKSTKNNSVLAREIIIFLFLVISVFG